MRTSSCLLLLATACSETSEAPTSVELQEVVEMTALPNPDLDILFVIDNSPSMLEEQAQLAANFPRMMDVLAELEGGIPNLHIAVVTSDLGAATLSDPSGGDPGIHGCMGSGDGGQFQTGSLTLPEPYLVDVDDGAGGRTRNYDGLLRDAFAQIASVGGDGCGFEQHLGAMERALAAPEQAGFLRADANLAIVFLADEDDCSLTGGGIFEPDSSELGVRQSFRCVRFGLTCDQELTELGLKTNCVPRTDSPFVADTQPFIDNVLALKADPRQVMVSAIVGEIDPVVVELRPPPGGAPVLPALAPSCTVQGAPTMENPSGMSTADPAVRITAFAKAFEDRNFVSTICDEDLALGLTGIGATAKKLVGDPCIDTSALADASPAPGTQPTCEVVDIAGDTETALPACTDGDGDCYELVRDATACPRQPENLRVSLRRSTAATAGTWTHVRCLPRQ